MELRRALHDHDLSFLRTVASLWGLPEPGAAKPSQAAQTLAAGMLVPAAVQAQLELLPATARAALEALVAAGGRQPAPQFTRKYGQIRMMGPARRDRERPWLSPQSPAEALYYRGLIFRGFFEARPSPIECFFVPDDLLALIRLPRIPIGPGAPGRPAPAPAHLRRAHTGMVDDACTLLAYLQTASIKLKSEPVGAPMEALRPHLLVPEAFGLLLHLVRRLGLASGSPLKPEPAAARPFLEAPRAEQLRRLAIGWRDDLEWNDLRHVPGLEAEGAWTNDPLTARQAILDLLMLVPVGEWWSLESFVSAVRERAPDFQRPGGDYDSWYLRDAATGKYLRGFDNWNRVEGGLIVYLITGPLHWFGLAESTDLSDSPDSPDAPEPSLQSQSAGSDKSVDPLSDAPEPSLQSQSAGSDKSVDPLSDAPEPSLQSQSAGSDKSVDPLSDAPEPSLQSQSAGSDKSVDSFRLTPLFPALLGQAEWRVAERAGSVTVRGDGSLLVSRAASRYDRFQIARVSDWVRVGDTFEYRLTPASLARAAGQGISVKQILAFLQKAAANPLPRPLVAGLQTWEREGAQASLHEVTVLKVKSPAVLEKLRRSPKTRRYLGEALGPLAVEVRRGDWQKLRAAMLELGIMADAGGHN